MPLPRFTVLRLMVAVAAGAVSFGLILGAEKLHNGYVAVAAYVLVPSLILLAVFAWYAVAGLVKFGKAPPFSIGYLLLGGLATFCFSLDLATQSCILDSMEKISHYLAEYMDDNHGKSTSLFSDRFIDFSIIFMFALPQVVLALIGGGLATRYRLTIIQDGRFLTSGLPKPVTDEV